jgi:citrate synthase
MSSEPETPTTRIATSTRDDVFIRDKSLCRELVGKLTFTEMIVFQMLGRRPSPSETRLVDACLVTLMEHGMTPSAVAARLVYSSAPEAMQAAVAAGLLGVGSRFAGTMEGCGALLARIASSAHPDDEATRIAEEHRASRTPLAGFGHPTHKPDDPRALRLLELCDAEGVAGANVGALRRLASAVDRTYGKHITINATGAIAAVLADCGVPYEILRGFALISRCAGLVGHVREEQQEPTLRAVWEAAERAVPYSGQAGK